MVSEHAVAAFALGVFLVVQIAAFSRLLWSVRQASGALDTSNAKSKPPEKRGFRFLWMEWCQSEVDSACHGSFDSARTAAMGELDRWLATQWCYLFLQRTSIMAPLLGVLITAGGFLGLNLPDGEAAPVRAIAAITPLVIGVGGGALLAFLNQLLLQVADTVIDKLRSRCGEWYDARYRAGEVEKERKRERSQELETAETLRQTAELNERLANMLSKTEDRTLHHAEQLQNLSKDLFGKLHVIPDRLQDLIATTDGAAKTLSTLAPLISQITGGFSSGVETFREAVEHKLLDALARNQLITNDTADIAASCKRAIDQLADGSSILKELAESQEVVTRKYLNTLENHIAPQQEVLAQTAHRLEAVVNRIASPLDALSQSLQRFTERLDGGAKGMEVLRESAGVFSKAVADQFAPAAELHRKVMAGVESDSERAREGADAMRQAIARFANSSEDLAAATEKNRQLIEQHAQPAHAMLERAAKEFERTAETMSEHADSYRAALISHSDGVSRLDDKVVEAIDAIQKATSTVSSSITTDLRSSLTDSADVIQRYDQLAERLGTAVEAMTKGVSGICRLSESYGGANEGLRDAMLASRDAVESLNATSSDLKKAVREGIVASQAEYSEVVRRLTAVTSQLDRFLGEGAVALAERINSLEGVFSSLRESVRGIATVAEASKDAERFMRALENAAALVESIKELPERLNGKAGAQRRDDGGNNKPPKKAWRLWRKN